MNLPNLSRVIVKRRPASACHDCQPCPMAQRLGQVIRSVDDATFNLERQSPRFSRPLGRVSQSRRGFAIDARELFELGGAWWTQMLWSGALADAFGFLMSVCLNASVSLMSHRIHNNSHYQFVPRDKMNFIKPHYWR